MEKRNSLISFLQSYGIMLVVLGHSTYQLGHAGHTPSVCTWLYQFHMPLFFFISGYLLCYTSEKKRCSPDCIQLTGRRGFIARKTMRLIVPYVALNSLAYLPKTFAGSMALRPAGLSLHEYVKMLLYPCDNVISFLWFLPSLFTIFMFFMVIVRTPVAKHMPTLMAALVVAGMTVPFHHIQFLYIGTSCVYLVFFVFGYYFRKHNIEKITERHTGHTAMTTFIISVAMVLIPDFTGRFYLAAFNGILMSVALGQIYVRHRLTFLNHLNGASYTIYLLSWFPQVASQQVLIHFVPGIPWQMTTALAFITGLYLPLGAYRLTLAHISNPAVRAAAPLIGIQPPQKKSI